MKTIDCNLRIPILQNWGKVQFKTGTQLIAKETIKFLLYLKKNIAIILTMMWRRQIYLLVN